MCNVNRYNVVISGNKNMVQCFWLSCHSYVCSSCIYGKFLNEKYVHSRYIVVAESTVSVFACVTSPKNA